MPQTYGSEHNKSKFIIPRNRLKNQTEVSITMKYSMTENAVDYAKIGQRVRAKRKQQKLTQGELAEMAHISTCFIGHIERGSRKLSISTLVSIANALGVGTQYLLQDSIQARNNEKIEALNPRNRQTVDALIDVLIAEEQNDSSN